jgi:hypothetical protein
MEILLRDLQIAGRILSPTKDGFWFLVFEVTVKAISKAKGLILKITKIQQGGLSYV